MVEMMKVVEITSTVRMMKTMISTVETDDHGGNNERGGDGQVRRGQVTMVGSMSVMGTVSMAGTDECGGDG